MKPPCLLSLLFGSHVTRAVELLWHLARHPVTVELEAAQARPEATVLEAELLAVVSNVEVEVHRDVCVLKAKCQKRLRRCEPMTKNLEDQLQS